jgi:outer membrane autotransporter protein
MLEYAPNAEFRNPEAGITGDVDYFFAGLVARYFLSPGRWQPYLQAGYGYARNKGEFARDGMRLEETHETGIANLGAGLRGWVNPNFGFSGAVEYNTVFDESADNSWTYKLGGVFATDRF